MMAAALERPFLERNRLSKSSFGPESYVFNVKDQKVSDSNQQTSR